MLGLINSIVFKVLDKALLNSIYFFQNLKNLHLVIADYINPKYEVIGGHNNYSSRDNVIILALHLEDGLSFSHMRLIEFYSNFCLVIAVCTSNLNESDLDFIVRHKCIAIERHNIGRDFGSYKAAMHWLRSKNHKSSIVMTNDSIFINTQLMSQFLSKVKGYSQVISLSKTYERHVHLGAFFLFIPSEIFLHDGFQKFWEKYIPFNSRRWSIFHGEVELSNLLFNISDSSTFPGEQCSMLTIEDFVNSMESGLMPSFHIDILKEINEQNILDYKVFNANQNKYLDLIKVTEAIVRINTISLHRSPAHFMGLYKFIAGQSAYLKKDVFYRGVFNIGQLTLLDKVNFCSDEEVLDMKSSILSRDFGPSYVGIKKYMFNRGLV